MWPALGAIASGVLSYMGAADQNSANAAQAQQQMEFQQNMYDTRYQRTVADLQAAGLNPMLAYQQGPGSSPGGAMATMQNALGAGVNSAQSGASIGPMIEQMKAQTGKNDADAKASNASALNTDTDTLLKQVLIDKAKKDVEISANTGQNISLLNARLSRENALDLGGSIAREAGSKADLTFAQALRAQRYNDSDKSDANNPNILSRDAREQEAGIANLQARGTLMGLQVPEYRAYSDYYKGAIGKAEPYVRAGEGIANSAASLIRAAPSTTTYHDTRVDSAGNQSEYYGSSRRSYGR